MGRLLFVIDRKMLLRLIVLLVVIAPTAFCDDTVSLIEDGDIIFHRSTSEQSHAIAAATGSQFTHMGVVFFEGGEPFVYEAVQPVKKTKLAAWIKRGKGGKFVVRRLRDRSAVDMDKLKREVSRFIGLDYDYKFGWSDAQIYCSELVWKAYQRSSGVEIGKLKQLKDFDLDNKIVRALLKKRYGKKIPLSMKVISPADVFESRLLETVGKAAAEDGDKSGE